MVQKRKRNKKWIYWVIILVLLIVAGVVAYLVWDNYFNDKKKDNDAVKEDTSQVEERKEAEAVEGTKLEANDETDGEEQKVKQYEGANPNNAETLSGTVTYAGVVDGVLMIRVNIDQYLSEGSCELTLSRGGATLYNSIASIIGSASTATCEGFDIPVSELGGNGGIEINIKLNANGKEGVIRGEASI